MTRTTQYNENKSKGRHEYDGIRRIEKSKQIHKEQQPTTKHKHTHKTLQTSPDKKEKDQRAEQ